MNFEPRFKMTDAELAEFNAMTEEDHALCDAVWRLQHDLPGHLDCSPSGPPKSNAEFMAHLDPYCPSGWSHAETSVGGE